MLSEFSDNASQIQLTMPWSRGGSRTSKVTPPPWYKGGGLMDPPWVFVMLQYVMLCYKGVHRRGMSWLVNSGVKVNNQLNVMAI